MSLLHYTNNLLWYAYDTVFIPRYNKFIRDEFLHFPNRHKISRLIFIYSYCQYKYIKQIHTLFCLKLATINHSRQALLDLLLIIALYVSPHYMFLPYDIDPDISMVSIIQTLAQIPINHYYLSSVLVDCFCAIYADSVVLIRHCYNVGLGKIKSIY